MLNNKGIIGQTFELAEGAYLDEATLLAALRMKVAEMLDHEIDLLLSTLYRLDVLEVNIQAVLSSPIIENDLGIAQLIINRQKEKLATRKKYQSKEIKIEDEWSF